MASSWRKVENDNGFPFYVKECDGTKQWDHPRFSDIKQRLDDCNYIKYASYRVASKFRVLQHALFMNEVPLPIICGVFEKHRLGATERSLCLESYDLEAILSDIYFAANKQSHTNTDVDFAVELMINFLYNVFDKERKSNVDVSSAKIALALLSNCKLPDLYSFVFSISSDHNSCVTRLRLQSLLSKIATITAYLNENAFFGHHTIHTSVEHCFNNSPGLVGVSECVFHVWLENVPQFFSWLPVLHRLKLSETVLYHGKCSVCKMSPMMGLRYRCLKCRSYIQCQRCFLIGRSSRSHKLTHTMREHCSESSHGWKIGFVKERLFGLIKCAYGADNSCISDICIVNRKTLGCEMDVILKPSVNENVDRIEPLSSPLSQLQVVIKQLELQNRELQQMLKLGVRSDKEMKRCLEEHRMHVETQIEKLKVLKDFINTSTTKDTSTIKLLESTPMVSNGKSSSRTFAGLDLFSPIVQHPPQHNIPNLPPISTNFATTMRDRDQAHDSLVPYSMQDISTWIGGQPMTTNPTYEADIEDNALVHANPPVQTDLDDALAKLQQILANNFSLDESLGNLDNCHLKYAVTEVEGMLSSIIDNAEIIKNSTTNKETDYVVGSSGYVTAVM